MAAQLNLNTEKIEKIKTQVQGINDTASAQATTIAEIAALLEGKSVPGGGGASVETCTVIIECGANVLIGGFYGQIAATTYENGVAATHSYYPSSGAYFTFPHSIENVICGSPLTLYLTYSGESLIYSCNGAELLGENQFKVFQVTAGAGETATITVGFV